MSANNVNLNITKQKNEKPVIIVKMDRVLKEKLENFIKKYGMKKTSYFEKIVDWMSKNEDLFIELIIKNRPIEEIVKTKNDKKS